jgi:ABC-type transport system involved in multi-copper enzyme maturation permease subunit
MNTTVLKALLWKDYRQNRMLFVAGLIMLMITPPTVWMLAYLVTGTERLSNFNYMLTIAVNSDIPISAVIVAMLGGTIIAADRADRSAAFLAFLPPSRGMVVLSKALCAFSAAFLLFFIIVVTGICSFLLDVRAINVTSIPQEVWKGLLLGISYLGSIGLLMFGTAWLAGSLSGSPAIASGVGIGCPVVLGVVILNLSLNVINKAGSHTDMEIHMRDLYCVIAIVVGLACFIAGCLHSLYRKTEV